MHAHRSGALLLPLLFSSTAILLSPLTAGSATAGGGSVDPSRCASLLGRRFCRRSVDAQSLLNNRDYLIKYDTDTYPSTKSFCNAFNDECIAFAQEVGGTKHQVDCVDSQPETQVYIDCKSTTEAFPDEYYDLTEDIMRFLSADLIAGPGDSAAASPVTTPKPKPKPKPHEATTHHHPSSAKHHTVSAKHETKTTTSKAKSTHVATSSENRKKATIKSLVAKAAEARKRAKAIEACLVARKKASASRKLHAKKTTTSKSKPKPKPKSKGKSKPSQEEHCPSPKARLSKREWQLPEFETLFTF